MTMQISWSFRAKTPSTGVVKRESPQRRGRVAILMAISFHAERTNEQLFQAFEELS